MNTLAITMWDFSWLERRWSGAGYQDWGRALDELVERGYGAVRIDAFPHLVAADPQRTWVLEPVWDCHDWGAPCPVEVTPMPALIEFIEACATRGVRVLLSTWFRKEQGGLEKLIATPEIHARLWIKTVQQLENAGVLNSIIGVDLCNEWPVKVYAPFYRGESQLDAQSWMDRAALAFKQEYPKIPLTYSWCGHHNGPRGEAARLAFANLDSYQ